MTSHTLYMTSHTWQHKSYIYHLTLYIWHYIHCICVIKPSVSIGLHPLCMTLHTICMTSHSGCMPSHEHFMTSHLYRYDITSSISMTSYPVYIISPLLFHENKTSIPGISPTVFDITAPASVWSHPLYQCLHKNYGSLHNWHMYDTIYTLHHIKFRVYDINCQYLGHHKHCIHYIGSTIYDITSMIYYISSRIPVTSQPLYR